MPTYRQPFLRGNLLVLFTIKFPEDDWLPSEKLEEVEKLLPARQEIMIPDCAEECTMSRYDARQESGSRRGAGRTAYDDEDEEGPQRVQCASH